VEVWQTRLTGRIKLASCDHALKRALNASQIGSRKSIEMLCVKLATRGQDLRADVNVDRNFPTDVFVSAARAPFEKSWTDWSPPRLHPPDLRRVELRVPPPH
jgi:hypothetical protein